MDTVYLSQQVREHGQSTRAQRVLCKFFTYGPRVMQCYLLAAVNAFMIGSHTLFEQGQRERVMVVVAQLDFNTAFTSTKIIEVFWTLEAYGVPAADMELQRCMRTGSWYSVAKSFGEMRHALSRKG